MMVLLIAIFCSICLTYFMIFFIKTRIPFKNQEPYSELGLGEFKGIKLHFLVGDIAMPNDVNKELGKYSLDKERTIYESFVISSVLTENGESWSWLPKTVGESINLVDETVGEKYENEIIKGINWKRNSNNTIKSFIVPEFSDFENITHIRYIYAISLFSAYRSYYRDYNREYLQDIVATAIKNIIEGERNLPASNKIAIPAISAVEQTTDSKYYLTYFQSWKSIFTGISRVNTTTIDDIYFVVWENLAKNPEHFKASIHGFEDALDIFQNKRSLAVIINCFIASILGIIYKCLAVFNRSEFKNITKIVVSIIPSLFVMFFETFDIIGENFSSFMNTNYHISSFVLCIVCFCFSVYIFSEDTEKIHNERNTDK